MATITTEIARTEDGLSTISVGWNSNGFGIRSFTIANGGGGTITATVYKDGTSGSWSLSAGPGQTASDTVPANLVSFSDDGTGNPAIPLVVPIPRIWYGEFGIWRWVVTV